MALGTRSLRVGTAVRSVRAHTTLLIVSQCDRYKQWALVGVCGGHNGAWACAYAHGRSGGPGAVPQAHHPQPRAAHGECAQPEVCDGGREKVQRQRETYETQRQNIRHTYTWQCWCWLELVLVLAGAGASTSGYTIKEPDAVRICSVDHSAGVTGGYGGFIKVEREREDLATKCSHSGQR